MQVPGLIVACYSLFDGCPWETYSFLREDEGGMNQSQRGSEWGETGRKGGRGKCGWDAIYEDKMKSKNNKQKYIIEIFFILFHFILFHLI